MQKVSKLFTGSSLFFAMMFSFYNSSNAQIINETTAAAPPSYDPIAATLDSLVNLNCIQRLNTTSVYNHPSGNFMPADVPVYTGEIYQKRMAKIQTPIPLCYNSQVKEYIDMYAVRKRALTERVMGLSGLYFPMYEQILDQQGLPLEFKYLSIVESALNPTAVSRVGATGLWQFMLGTGKLYNLKINSLIDERRDPEKATYAACQYFKDMYAIYNDWLLVVAAYNCGAGNVNRAIARSGGKKTFWEIAPYLPKETRGYVPAFIAVTYLMSYPAEHNLTAVPPVMTYFEADTVLVDQKVSLRNIADATNTPLDLLMYLNPVYKKGIVPDADEQMPVRLPSGKITAYLANLAAVYKPDDNDSYAMFATDKNSIDDVSLAVTPEKKFIKVKKGERIELIAGRYDCSVTQLKKWNHLRSTHLVAGQKLAVYVYPAPKPLKLAVKENAADPSLIPDSSSHSAQAAGTAQVKTDKDLKVIYHTVAPGDTLWKIAQSYEGVTVDQLIQLNNLESNDLKVGTRLKVQVGS